MKYSPQIYARVFSEIVCDPSFDKKEEFLVKNFLGLIAKNNDQHQLKKIIALAEKLVRAKTGRRKLVIETARPVKKLDNIIKKIIKKDDIVEEKINKDLIAGLKVVLNDEMQFDGSMQRKIKKLFS
jgi:F0F1-type ATP synthase delta subunit